MGLVLQNSEDILNCLRRLRSAHMHAEYMEESPNSPFRDAAPYLRSAEEKTLKRLAAKLLPAFKELAGEATPEDLQAVNAALKKVCHSDTIDLFSQRCQHFAAGAKCEWIRTVHRRGSVAGIEERLLSGTSGA